MKKPNSKGQRQREMAAMYLACMDIRKVAAHFHVKITTARRNIRAATNEHGVPIL